MDYTKLKLSLMVAAFALAGLTAISADKAEAKGFKVGSTVGKIAVKSAIKANRKRSRDDGSDNEDDNVADSSAAGAPIADSEREAAFKRAAEKLAAEKGAVVKTASEQVNTSAAPLVVNDITCLAGCYK